MSNHDGDAARIAALMEGLEAIAADFKAREAQEMETGCCADCGGQLVAFWKEHADMGEPKFFCVRCRDRDEGR